MNIPIEVYEKGQVERYIELVKIKDSVRVEQRQLLDKYSEIKGFIRELVSSTDERFSEYIFYEEDFKKGWERPWTEAGGIEALSKELLEIGGQISEKTYKYVELLDELRVLTDYKSSII